MADLPKYEALTTVNRGAPCAEYPGVWHVYSGSEVDVECETLEEAVATAKVYYGRNFDGISVCWEMSNDDPRIGEVWFTPFYCHGKINQFGEYRTQ